MSSSRILFPQFRDEQADSKYPFADHVTLLATNTGIKLPTELFLDASFFGIGANVGLYLSAVIVTTQTVTITVGDNGTDKKFTAAYASANPPDSGVLNFVDTYNRPAGLLIATPTIRNTDGTIKEVTPLVALAAWPAGEHKFSAATAEFVASVSVPAQEPGVRAITATSATEIDTGDVWLVGNGGIVLRVENENTIRVDVVGVPLFKRFVCAPLTSFPTKKFLRTINGCGPDEYGNFTFTATGNISHLPEEKNLHPVIRVYPTGDAINFDTVGPQVS
jgi:hypothetical protein